MEVENVQQIGRGNRNVNLRTRGKSSEGTGEQSSENRAVRSETS